MYQVVTDEEVNAQVEALPDELLPYYAQALDLLELAPWSSRPYSEAKPDGVMRTLRFGPDSRSGEVIFLLLEADRRIEIVRVYWLH